MRTLPTSLALLWFLGLGLVAAAAPAWAQEPDARAAARALAQEGARLFEQGDLQAALDRFKRAYDKFPSPKLFLNIGQAQRGLGRNLEALDAFERFLAEAKDANPEFQEQAKAQVLELRGKLGRIHILCNRPGAAVTLDGEARGTIPLGRSLLVEPGPHRLMLSWEGLTKSADLTVAAGQELAPVVDFQSPPPLPPPAVIAPEPVVVPLAPPPPAPVARTHTWYWIAGGAVVVAVATTLIVIYARSDRYPTADLGTRTIGDFR